MNNVDEDIADAWRRAADDLGIEVVAPVEVGNLTGIAHITSFGAPGGTIVLRRGGQLTAEITSAAKANGYFVSIVNGDSYQTYDRGLFIETLDDWGWFGDPTAPPRWYTGAPWGS